MSIDQTTQARIRAASSLPSKLFAAAGVGGLVALSLVLVSIVVIATPLFHTVRGALTPSPEAVSGKIDAAEQAQAFKGSFAGNVAQTAGRSLFYVPSAPGTEATVIVEPELEDENGKPRAPSKYDGPAIQAIVLDEVWFADSTRVSLGKSKGDIEVLAVNAPWDATLRWKGGEFTVPLFTRDRIVFKDGVKTVGLAPQPTGATNAADAAKVEPNQTEPNQSDPNQSGGNQSDAPPANSEDVAPPDGDKATDKPVDPPAASPTSPSPPPP